MSDLGMSPYLFQKVPVRNITVRLSHFMALTQEEKDILHFIPDKIHFYSGYAMKKSFSVN